MHKLIPTVKNYAWGSNQEESLVKKIFTTNVMLIDGTNQQLQFIQEQENWAEIWVGSHPSGMTRTINGEPITKLIPEGIPFIFKVLSIEKSLSIQLHPDEVWAKMLHSKDPNTYPDSFPKPEMAIAIDYLDAFCGYCDYSEMISNIIRLPSLHQFLLKNLNNYIGFIASTQESNIKICLEFFLDLDQKCLDEVISNLAGDIASINEPNFRERSILKLVSEFGNDVGVLVSLLLKIERLKPFDYLTLGPFVPHAYISGSVFECMAPSDNVIRLGLTPKFKDTATFLNMYQYLNQTDTKKQPLITPFENGELEILQFPHELCDYFQIVIIRNATKKTPGIEAKGFQISPQSDTIILNMESPIVVNGKLIQQYEYYLIKQSCLKIEKFKSEPTMLILCTKKYTLE